MMLLVQICVGTLLLLACTSSNIAAFTNLSFFLGKNNKNTHQQINVHLWAQNTFVHGKGEHDDDEQLQNQQQQQHQSSTIVSRRLFFSATAAVATVVASSTQSNHIASALEISSNVPVVLQSSSIHVAEIIRTLDMSLPTSYDELKSSKASVSNVKSLSVDVNVASSSKSAQKSKSSSSSATASSTSSTSTGSSSAQPKKEKEKPVKVGEYIF